jgi:hypothetical protein
MEHDQVQLSRHAGELTGALVKPAQDANGWVILLLDSSGREIPYTGHSGDVKVYRDLDRATLEARELGFDEVRVEECF